jgi:hypothetical protein
MHVCRVQSAECRVQSADCTITLLHFGVVEHSAELSIMLGIMQTSLSLWSFEHSGPITLFSSLDARGGSRGSQISHATNVKKGI